MQLLMFSGNSLRNRDWIHAVNQRFASLFDSTYVQEYRHWQTGADWIDLPHELTALEQKSSDFQPPYGVFAKSIGTVLAVQAVQQGVIKPDFFLFCGVPLNFIIATKLQFSSDLQACSVPTVLVHNEHDSVGSAEELQQYLGLGHANITFIATPGEDHNYEDYDLLGRELIKLRDAA